MDKLLPYLRYLQSKGGTDGFIRFGNVKNLLDINKDIKLVTILPALDDSAKTTNDTEVSREGDDTEVSLETILI